MCNVIGAAQCVRLGQARSPLHLEFFFCSMALLFDQKYSFLRLADKLQRWRF